MQTITTLNELTRTDLPLAGGKGANLGAMIQAGLPVPPGFCVTTAGYNAFVAANRLEEAIQAQVAAWPPDDPLALDEASASIRRLFEGGRMPEAMAAEIRAAYRALSGGVGDAAVAVRSSATAEDLPDMSFAGQQDTYLNIVGEAALLDAVTRCWASLWTARAIGYRARNQIDSTGVALAVVVQRMVQSEASGVLFTANPLTGKRSETVVDATLGLGEALVSGIIEPDHYVVEDSGAGETVTQKTLGSKAVAVRGVEGGGTRVVEETAAAVQALPDAQILALARVGRAAERFFGAPQDMEWGWAGGRLYVLQSRAITSLYPIPQRWTEPQPAPQMAEPAGIPAGGPDGKPLKVFFSFASWQGMLQPISPLGMDSFTGLVVGFARALGAEITARDQDLLLPAGDRLFVNVTSLIRSPFGRKVARTFIGAIDPISEGIIAELFKDPRLALDEKPMSLQTRLRLIRALAPLVGGVIYNIMWPERGRKRLQVKIDEKIGQITSEFGATGTTLQDLPRLFNLVETLPNSTPSFLLPYLLPGIVSGMASMQMLLRQASDVEDGESLVMELTRGLPYNVTTEMDLKLWAVSRAILSDPQSVGLFQAASADRISAEYRAGRLPPAAQQALDGFMRAYGARGVAEIDIYKPRWKETPQHIVQVLQSYLEMDEAQSPEAVFRNGAEKARLAGQTLAARFRRTRFGWVRAPLARFLISRMRQLAGLRETPKFTIVRILALCRDAMLRAGETMAREGLLESPEDIFFLHLWELRDRVAGKLPGARELIAQRCQAYQREMSRRQIPRVILNDGTTYYNGFGFRAAGVTSEESEGVLTGSPVSAGVVEGTVRVVLDPHGTRLLPGEILVCPATDPAWTPLFLAAGGLVMEVGGMITHGSVVAREYGIPAVVGVDQATTRLQTGQRVRVDGSTGVVTVLE